jgi:hypothetical protein
LPGHKWWGNSKPAGFKTALRQASVFVVMQVWRGCKVVQVSGEAEGVETTF